MNVCCAVYGCTSNLNNTDPSIQYYYFPKHPLILQQWVSACWRPDPIDVNTAQICSLHFSNSCYTSEYKRDFFGNYTKILKFDSVPNLYLPNNQPTVVIKTDTESNFNRHQVDGKEFVVYQVDPLPMTNNILTVETQLINNRQLKCDEKCNSIVNQQELEDLVKENKNLKQTCTQFEIIISKLNGKIEKEQKAVKELDEEIKKITDCNESLQSASMSLNDQKIILSKVFSESQIKILSGKKKIYWSNDDMAMGYTIRHLSNKRCYLYLSKNLNIPLPALSSIKRWSTLKKNEFKNEPKNESKFEEDSE